MGRTFRIYIGTHSDFSPSPRRGEGRGEEADGLKSPLLSLSPLGRGEEMAKTRNKRFIVLAVGSLLKSRRRREESLTMPEFGVRNAELMKQDSSPRLLQKTFSGRLNMGRRMSGQHVAVRSDFVAVAIAADDV